MSSLAVTFVWWLLALPLCLVPFLGHPQRVLRHSWLALVPADRFSPWFDRVRKLIAAVLFASLIFGLAGLHRAQYPVERIGRGAHMVLLVDRSRSMDQPFGRGYRRNAVGVSRSGTQSKGRVARQLLGQFVAQRDKDLFGLVAFSTFPVPILELTRNHAVVQAAIAAGNIGRGLSETNIGAGLERALAFFEEVPYTGSRIVVLVSDGAAELNESTRLRIINMINRLRVSLYWIYIRSAHGPRIVDDPKGEADGDADDGPERTLHGFFSEMGAPYKAYTADSPQALQRAIADVAQLQNLPIRYVELIPRRDLSALCYRIALCALLLLVMLKLLEVRRW